MTTCPIEHLSDLKHDLETPLKKGLISADFFRECLSSFKLSPDDYRDDPKSIIVTAAPQLPQATVFRYHGQECNYTVPPTYTDKTDKIIEKIITETISSYNYRIMPAFIPVKITAVRTGLSKYGRNNITYCHGMGSYFRLKAFMTDLPVDEIQWHEFELIPQCHSCQACLRACPTGAIRADRILLQSDRCLTFFNEKIDEFPKWIKKSWHNSLIGCMRCQIVCPVNKGLDMSRGDRIMFSEEETEKFISAGDKQSVPDSVLVKLRELSLDEDWRLVARNLRVLLG